MQAYQTCNEKNALSIPHHTCCTGLCQGPAMSECNVQYATSRSTSMGIQLQTVLEWGFKVRQSPLS